MKVAFSALQISLFSLFAVAAFATPPGWQLVWEDDFDSLDDDTWNVISSHEPTNKSLHAYLREQVSVADGKLEILSENQPSGGLPYRSGQIISHASQRFGRWEVHAKMPTTTGMWPAIWLLPDVKVFPWPSGGEIDIMENRGETPTITNSAFHYGTNPPFSHKFVDKEQQTRFQGELVNYSADYHTYAVDWTEKYLRFYLDGVNYYTVYDEDVGGFLSQHIEPMQLVINNAIGGTFLKNPDESTEWPQTMYVDWVRVYKATPAPEPISFVNPGFEMNGGSLAGWSLFGNNTPEILNVSSSIELASEGATSLKLYGQFAEGVETYSGASQGITVTEGDKVEASLKARVRSSDSIVGSDNSVAFKLEFYSEFGAKFGSPEMLSEEILVIADRNVEEDAWTPHTIRATAPEGAAEARLTVIFVQPNTAGGAVFIDEVNLVVSQ